MSSKFLSISDTISNPADTTLDMNGNAITGATSLELTSGLISAPGPINIGFETDSVSTTALNIGYQSGKTGQAERCTNLGAFTGTTGQEIYATSVGFEAGQTDQETYAIALGSLAGRTSQGHHSIACGAAAGYNMQGSEAVAVGNLAGEQEQGDRGIALGYQAGHREQGIAAIAIGAFAGEYQMGDNSIVISAQGSALQNSVASSCRIAPLRDDAAAGDGTHVLEYDDTTKEVTKSLVSNFVKNDGNSVIDGELVVTHTAVEDDDHAIEIIHDAAGFADSKALEILYDTGAQAANTEDDVILVSIDDSSAAGGEVAGVVVVATEGAGNVIALEVGATVDPLLHLVGSFATPSVTNLVISWGADIAWGSLSGNPLFPSDNDTIEIHDANTFEEIEFLFDVFSSQSISPTFEYQTVGPVWTSFTPVDGTDGFRANGVIVWNAALVPGQVADGGLYKIRITRTRNNVSTDSEANTIKVAAISEYGWDKNADLSINSLTVAGEETIPVVISRNLGAANNFVIGSGGQGLLADAFGNVLIGDLAGEDVTTGDSNMLIGPNAGNDLTTGNNNVCIGIRAGGAGSVSVLSTGSDNVVIGRDADVNDDTSTNVAIGVNADVSGGSSVSIGESTICSGSQSVALGYQATASGTKSTAIGRVSVATAENSIAIGNSASSTHSHSIAIGVQATTTGNNQFMIGDSTGVSHIKEVVAGGTGDTSLGTSSLKFSNLHLSGSIHFAPPSGATQVASGASAGEVWKTNGHATLPNNVLMIGV